jgi:regulatory protein YycI of two-component signal transduction system YycFG
MGNENRVKGSINPNKNVVISKNLLKGIVIGVFIVVCVFLTVTYFNSGLTHKKAKDVFVEYWNKKNTNDKLEEVKILGIKR